MLSVSRLAWVVLGLALVGATASLFGPQERWWGVDIGSTGAAVFGLTLWIGAWLFARYPDSIFPADWSIAERRAWAGLVFVLLVFLNFLRFMAAIAQLYVTPVSLEELPSRHFMWNLFVLLIAWAVVAKTLRGTETELVELDERDQRFQYEADRAGDWTLTLVVIVSVVLLVTLSDERLSWWLAPLIAANSLIGLLIVRSLVEYVFLVARYARARR
jgi:hypothetical protein